MISYIKFKWETENWPPGKLASWKIGLLDICRGGKLASFGYFRGPNVYTSLILLNSALHSSH